MNYEVNVVQKEMERLLCANGKHFSREEPMPLQGKADFVVHIKDARVLIECKRNCDSIRSSIAQVIFYRAQMMDDAVIPTIVVPQGTITDEAVKLCARYNVKLKSIYVKTLNDYEYDSIFPDDQ